MMENKNIEMKMLNEDELEMVIGGRDIRTQMMQIQCSCGMINLVDISKNSYKCKKCNKVNSIDG